MFSDRVTIAMLLVYGIALSVGLWAMTIDETTLVGIFLIYALTAMTAIWLPWTISRVVVGLVVGSTAIYGAVMVVRDMINT